MGDTTSPSRARLTELLDGLRREPTGSGDYIRDVVTELSAGIEELLGAEERLRTQTEELSMSRDATEEEIRFLHVEIELLVAIGRVARLTSEPRPIDSLLQSIVDLAAIALPGCELGLSLTSVKAPVRGAAAIGGRPGVLAASGERARRLDEAEWLQGDGPCLQAISTGSMAEVDVARCAHDWPVFGALARELALVTAIGVPVQTPDHRGALNVFAFVELSREARELLPFVVEQLVTAVANAELYESAHLLAIHLERALESRGVIERAKGVLIARQGCDPDQAFDILRRASQRLNRKLRDISTDLVVNAETGEVPDWAPLTAGRTPATSPAREPGGVSSTSREPGSDGPARPQRD
jgi:hypothetical protein